MSHVGGQTGDPVPDLCFGHSKSIGALGFQFEDLSQFRPGAVISSHAAHGNRPFFPTSVTLLHRADGAEIGGRSRSASQFAMRLKEHLNVFA
jgi:hypothetical protein